MVLHIGKIYRGGAMSITEVATIALKVGLANVVGQIGTLEALNLAGPFGIAAKTVIAGSIIKILGDNIIEYFEKNPLED